MSTITEKMARKPYAQWLKEFEPCEDLGPIANDDALDGQHGLVNNGLYIITDGVGYCVPLGQGDYYSSDLSEAAWPLYIYALEEGFIA